MATRSGIAMMENKNLCRAIYCHWGGSPDENGATLLHSYTNKDSVRALVNLGSLSELGENEKTCIAHHRDRGEDIWTVRGKTPRAVFKELVGSDIEYLYLYQQGGWFVAKVDFVRKRMGRFQPLKEIINP